MIFVVSKFFYFEDLFFNFYSNLLTQKIFVVRDGNKVKINSSNFQFFIKFYKNEFKTTIYLNFKNIDFFRKLKFYFIVLYWFEPFDKFVLLKRSKVIFELLTNVFNFDLFRFYGKNLKKLLTLYRKNLAINDVSTIKNNNNVKNYMYADIFYLCTKNLKNLINLSSDCEMLIQKFIKTQLSLIKTISKIDLLIVIFSILKFLFEKNNLKKYNKINILLKFF